MNTENYKRFLEEETNHAINTPYHFGAVDEDGVLVNEDITTELDEFKDAVASEFLNEELNEDPIFQRYGSFNEILQDIQWMLLEKYANKLKYKKTVYFYDYNNTHGKQFLGVWFTPTNFFDVCERHVIPKATKAWENRRKENGNDHR